MRSILKEGLSDLRGLRDIRTRSGKADGAKSYMGYIRMGFLEMERARRTKELQSIERRKRDVETRLAQIEAEKQAILNGLEQPSKKQSAEAQSTEEIAGEAWRKTKTGLKIRY